MVAVRFSVSLRLRNIRDEKAAHENRITTAVRKDLEKENLLLHGVLYLKCLNGYETEEEGASDLCFLFTPASDV